MRVTNGMMISNSMNNINTNKQLMSIYENQQATEKKIMRPSDDPVIAIRALKYRTSLNEISQYVDKNIPDAESWISTTQGALNNISEMFTDIFQYCNQGSTDSFKTDNRESIIDSLQKLKDSVYGEGNVDFAGRYVFTGYKTDKTLIFQSDDASLKYSITQDFKGTDIEKFTYTTNKVDVNNITDLTSSVPDGKDVYLIKFAYNDTDDKLPTFTYTDANGAVQTVNITAATQTNNAYETVLNANGAKVSYDAVNGQLVMNEAAYKQYIEQDNMTITYEKTGFNKGEVRPEHYFKCSDITDAANPKDYNVNAVSQDIYYNINYGQTLKVNTQANESIDIYIGRTIQDMQNTLSTLKTAEEKVSKLKSMINSGTYTGNDLDNLNSMLEAANMEVDYAKKNVQTVFSQSNTKMKNYQKTVELGLSELGSRDSRLSLVKARLKEQQNNIKELQSKNEDVELEEAVINLAQAQMVYNASLNAASKIVQQSLVDFI